MIEGSAKKPCNQWSVSLLSNAQLLLSINGLWSKKLLQLQELFLQPDEQLFQLKKQFLQLDEHLHQPQKQFIRLIEQLLQLQEQFT